MPCYQSTNLPSGVTTTGRTSYTTEADCNQACKEGACCEGTTCTVKPQCQCQGTGKTFKGVGTTCADGTGFCCGPDTWQAQALIVGSGIVSFPSAQSFPKCGAGGSTRAACESAGGQWITSPCVSCAEVNEKTGIGGSQKFVCYPSPNPLP